MGQTQDPVSSSDSKLAITRRGFVKGAVAVSTAAALYGCSKGDDGEVVILVGGGLLIRGYSQKIFILLKLPLTVGVQLLTTAAAVASQEHRSLPTDVL